MERGFSLPLISWLSYWGELIGILKRSFITRAVAFKQTHQALPLQQIYLTTIVTLRDIFSCKSW